MNDAALRPDYLGPSTEARFAEAFAHRAILSLSEAAALIGVDPKTMPALPIRSVPKGKHRGYAELPLRKYLLGEPTAECEAKPVVTVRTKARPAPATNVRLVNFSERARRKR
jgi:hypothetical protein